MTATKVQAFQNWHKDFMPKHILITERRNIKGNLLREGKIDNSTKCETVTRLVNERFLEIEKNKRLQKEAEKRAELAEL